LCSLGRGSIILVVQLSEFFPSFYDNILLVKYGGF
jgi:hypothetical protein